jgi:hypothetical protein
MTIAGTIDGMTIAAGKVTAVSGNADSLERKPRRKQDGRPRGARFF